MSDDTQNDLLHNLAKLHTTEMGVIRIKKNLALETDDSIITVPIAIQLLRRIKRDEGFRNVKIWRVKKAKRLL